MGDLCLVREEPRDPPSEVASGFKEISWGAFFRIRAFGAAQILSDDRPMDGTPHPALVEHVYAELRRLASSHMARETAGHTLQPTALVHEVYLRLMGDRSCPWDDRGQILAAAALTMRRILVEAGRRRRTDRRGGQLARVELRVDEVTTGVDATHIADLDDALLQLEEVDAQMARVVELRYFGGLTIEETASVVGVSPRTVRRDWEAARLWLFRKMGGEQASKGADVEP